MNAMQNRKIEGMFATFLLLNGAYHRNTAYQPKEYEMDLSPVGVIMSDLGSKILGEELPELANVGVYWLQKKLVMSSRLANSLDPFYTSEYRRKERQRIIYYDLPAIDFSVHTEEDSVSVQKKYRYIQNLASIVKSIADYMAMPTKLFAEKLQGMITHYMVSNELKPHELIMFFGQREQFERLFLLHLAINQIQLERG